MKALYQRDVGRGAPLATLAYLCAEEGVEGEDAAFARDLLGGVLANLPELDRVIAAKATQWRLDRLANVDRNILRLAVFELTHGGDVPASVAINEAVELAKVYGGPESGRFVNGVLGQVARELGAAVPETASPPAPAGSEPDADAGVAVPAGPEPGADAGVGEPGARLAASDELAPPAAGVTPATARGRRRRRVGSGEPTPAATHGSRAAGGGGATRPRGAAGETGPGRSDRSGKAEAPPPPPRPEGEPSPGAKR